MLTSHNKSASNLELDMDELFLLSTSLYQNCSLNSLNPSVIAKKQGNKVTLLNPIFFLEICSSSWPLKKVYRRFHFDITPPTPLYTTWYTCRSFFCLSTLPIPSVVDRISYLPLSFNLFLALFSIMYHCMHVLDVFFFSCKYINFIFFIFVLYNFFFFLPLFSVSCFALSPLRIVVLLPCFCFGQEGELCMHWTLYIYRFTYYLLISQLTNVSAQSLPISSIWTSPL